jgi:hypothetical protein
MLAIKREGTVKFIKLITSLVIAMSFASVQKDLKRLKAVVSQGTGTNLSSYTTKLKDALCVNVGIYLIFY